MRTTSAAGLAAIKAHEGLRLKAYPDPGSANGLPVTIGYGSTTQMDGGPWKLGDEVTEAYAEALLRRDLLDAERAVNESVTVPLSQAQFDALVSFVFNVGASAFKSSTLLRKLNAGDYAGAAEQFGAWINNDGQPLEGLRRRRQAERAMFESAAPIVEAQPVKEPPVAPIISAVLPSIVAAIPELTRIFGSGSPTAERNAQAAEKVVSIVQAATGAVNAQQAAERVVADPVARTAAQDAIRREYFDLIKLSEQSVADARKFNEAWNEGAPFIKTRSISLRFVEFLSLLLVILAAVGGFIVLEGDGFSPEIKASVVTLILIGGFTAVIGFWLGSSRDSQRKTEMLGK